VKIAFTYNLQVTDAEEEAEFDSPSTVRAIVSSLERLGHLVESVDVSRPVSSIIAQLEEQLPDLIFNTAEGSKGRFREGFFPALFEQLGFIFTGSDAFVCTLTLDKHLTKLALAARGIPTPRWVFVDNLEDWRDPDLRYPLIVKPNAEGSSMGIGQHSVIQDATQLRGSLAVALRHYPDGMIVEEYISGRDVVVPFLESASPEAGGVLAACEYSVDEAIAGRRKYQIYDYELKHSLSDAVTVIAPAKLSPALAQRLHSLSLQAYRALGIRDLGRIDFRISDAGEPFFVEANALPSLEPGAGIYAAARLAGLETTEQVLDAVIQSALRRRTAVRPAVNSFPVRSSPGKGRGVFAQRSWQPGELIERAPVLALSPADTKTIQNTLLDSYYYVWGNASDEAAIALGYGSLYNHSWEPNAIYVRRPELNEIHFLAHRSIAPGDEITVNYNGSPGSRDPLDFVPVL
jgi:D-alanine-D-alanine ligase